MSEDARSSLMHGWLETMEQQNLMPVLLLGVNIDDPTQTALFVAEGIGDDVLIAEVLHELSQTMQREASS